MWVISYMPGYINKAVIDRCMLKRCVVTIPDRENE